MTHDELKYTITKLLERYMANDDSFDSNPQLRVNPATMFITIVNGSDMLAEIDDSNTAIEEAAGVDGDNAEDSADYQVRRNPDFYPVKALVKESDGRLTVNPAGVEEVVRQYAHNKI